MKVFATLLMLVLPLVSHAQEQRDIVLIVTDDQPYHTLPYLQNVNRLLANRGTVFDNYFVNVGICGPSRCTNLTGQFSHNHGMFGNADGFQACSDANTLPVWLNEAGYETAMVGKYINHYGEFAPYQPPGWTDWYVFKGVAYYDFALVENGVIKGYRQGQYSTEVLRNKAVAFIKGVPPGTPLFLYFAPYAPHTPTTPADVDEGTFEGLPAYRPPSYNEADVSDKPAWVKELPALTLADDQKFENLQEDQVEALQSVDRAFLAIYNAIRNSGRLDNTVFIFTSDNGYSLGAHRWDKKLCPYEECIKEPLIIKVPGGSHRRENRVASNVDLAPTIADFAGISPGGLVNGITLKPVVEDPDFQLSREGVLIENLSGDPTRSGYWVRTETHMYGEYGNGNKELYDLGTDPWQERNAVTDQSNSLIVSDLKAKLEALKSQ